MYESNAPEIIKYLTEDDLKLMYGRLNRRFVVVDALPAVETMSLSNKNAIYVVKESVGDVYRYWPYVLENNEWKILGIGQQELDRKIDKVAAIAGHLVVANDDGSLVDANIMPGTFVALSFDPTEQIQPHATDIRKIWDAFQTGMPVILLDNRSGGTGLYAPLNAAGYTWPDGNHMAERLVDVDENYRPCNDTIPGYYDSDTKKFYADIYHSIEIDPIEDALFHDLTDDKVYLYAEGEFVRILRFVQFSTNELMKDDPAWSSRKSARPIFFRVFEPMTSATANNFYVVYGEYTTTIKVNVDPEIMYGNGVEEPLGVYDYDGENAGLVPDAPDSDTDKKFLRADGQWETITIPEATQNAPGIMSTSDKTKLDGIEEGANAYTHPSHTAHNSGMYKVTIDAQGHVSAVAAIEKSDITALDIPAQDTTYNFADDYDGTTNKGATEATVRNAVSNAINALDKTENSTGGTNIEIKIVEENGLIKEIKVVTDNTVNATDVNTAIETALANYGGFKVVQLTSDTPPVPDVQNPSEKYIYLTKDSQSSARDPYTEWIYIKGDASANPPTQNRWEVIGETSVDLFNYIQKVSGATENNFTAFTSDGAIKDSGKNASDFATLAQGIKAESSVQSVSINNGTKITPDSNGKVNLPLASTTDPGVMSASDKSKLDGINNYIESMTVDGRTLTLIPKSGPAVTFNDTGDINVIEKISVNGTQQTVTNKEVDLTIPVAANNAKITLKVGGVAVGDTTPVAGDFTVDQSPDKDIVIPAAVSASGNEPAKPGVMSSADKAKLDGIPEIPNDGTPGQVLTKTQNGVAWSDPESASLPVATESDSVLYTAEPNGEASWVQMEKTVYGSIMTDEEGTPILDEEGHNIQDEDIATLWTGFNGKGFGAVRAAADENGNSIVATYATKTDVETAMGDIETLLAAL